MTPKLQPRLRRPSVVIDIVNQMMLPSFNDKGRKESIFKWLKRSDKRIKDILRGIKSESKRPIAVVDAACRDGADGVRVLTPERALDLAAGGRHGRGEWLRGGDCDVGGRGGLRPALAGAVLSEGLALALAPSHADVDDSVDGLVCVGVWLP